MTVRELKDHLANLDDSCEIAMQSSDGMEHEITSASRRGDQLIFWTES